MDISIKKGILFEQFCDILIVYVFQGVDRFDDFISKILKEEKFKAKLCQTVLIRTGGHLPAKRVLVVGLGKKEEFDFQSLRRATASAYFSAKSIEPKTIVSEFFNTSDFESKEIAQAVTESIRLADYSFTKYKKENGNGKRKPQSFEFVTDDGRIIKKVQSGISLGELTARATIFARDLINTPTQDMSPRHLVEFAKSIAKGKSTIRVRVFDEEKLEKMGAGGILGIAKGSDDPPFFVHMIYHPKIKAKKKIAIVGKGVTFDSGGLSLKPAASMSTMKIDMAGAADVLGLFSVINEIAPAVEVHGIFAAVENMPSGRAVRPGDILKAMNGKTMEILNTDAEGRVILADSLVYATKQKPDMIVDLATLTGACMVALGEEITGLLSNDSKLANLILTAAAKVSEKMWELPLEKNYKQFTKSDVADLKNIGGKYGDVISAGLFLEEFVNKTPWAHLDIAGPSFAERDFDEYTKKGATGHGVRTLIEFLRGF
ncbi:leucyl aminopeptidase [Candidatus Uhrbacteria bacterium]|nr:leucyl aminopeptidase [Candidatus Uhrbacteria bacterium]